ncbi:MAG: hypothetical protein MH252_19595, partial [Thermosynechococcaceae cyanobacterium MS004]|nr:hypothetical protein [Thermosynechococcaceae cyanobacterium MS004]
QDGERFLSQSDQARSLKDPGQIAAYIDQVKATVPTLREWKQEREATQEQQQETPIVPAPIAPPIAPPITRSVVEPAQPEMPAAQPIVQPPPLAQPKPPAVRPAPINAITDRQKAEERVALAAASVKQQLRGQYDEIAQQVMAKLGSVPPEVIDLEVFLKNASNPEQAKRLIQVGDTMSALRDSNSDFHGSYFDAIMRVAPAYEAIKNDPDAKMNYRHMALIVTNTNAKLKLEKNPEPTIRRKKEREDELTL